MITKNGIELTDQEYRDKLKSSLDILIEEMILEEDYEMCQCCVDMKNDIDNENIESIKDMLTKITVLMNIRSQLI